MSGNSSEDVSLGICEESLICPKCKAKLKINKNELICLNNACRMSFPIINNTPILINEENSIFNITDYFSYAANTSAKVELKSFLIKAVPSISLNVKAAENCRAFINIVKKHFEKPKILVIGGCVLGKGMEAIVNSSDIQLVESDVIFGPRTKVIFDAHDIPYEDNSFHAVIIQAVLEHVLDPHRCVEEIYRTLKKGGFVYAETPFMQQVHGREHDFTRFTHLGHRRLFRMFKEIESGAACGPGMALAWSYQYFLISFVKKKLFRRLLIIFARTTSFWLKYIDYYLINKPGALDAASGFYFYGQKSEKPIADKDIVAFYRGAC
jgi:SAM-dependent methyltransferase/uncharacterized protein YbaR (Trm112 family)